MDMKEQVLTRRAFMHGILFTLFGAVLGGLGISGCQRQEEDHSTATTTSHGSQDFPASSLALERDIVLPSLALSLTVLQQKVQAGGRHLPDELATLSTLNRIRGFLAEPDRDLVLLGDRDPNLAPIHLDDLVIALRNAYQVSSTYQGAPGCSIDPMPGSNPWRIQQVAVFGMPASTPMAARHVAIDYELKKVSSGLVALGDSVPSLYELGRKATPLCAGSQENEERQTVHRFWFYPLYPEAPRFLELEEGADVAVLILKPVQVQLLTELQFLDERGRRSSSAPADPLAAEFARRMTEFLAKVSHLPYAQLRADFQVIEVGKLLAFKQVSADRLHHLLYEYALPEVPVPTFVGGIRRDERGEVVCESQIKERRASGGSIVESHELVKRFRHAYRGGVEAKIELPSPHFVGEKKSSGLLADLQRRVWASRPSPNALLWSIHS